MKRLVWLSAVAMLGGGQPAAQAPRGVPAPLWDEAQRALLLEPADLHLRTDYVDRDLVRLPAVDRAMHDFTALPAWLAAFADSVSLSTLRSADGTAGGLAALAAPPGAEPATLPPRAGYDTTLGFPRSVSLLLEALETVNSRSALDSARGHATVPDSLHDLLLTDFPRLLWEDAGEEFRSPEWQDSVQQAEEAVARRMAAALPFVPRARIFADGLLVAGSFAAWADGLAASGVDRWRRLGKEHRQLEIFETAAGRVAFGTIGPDSYRGPFAFILDPGGSDTYELEYDSRHPSRIIVDLDGDDRYFGRTDAAIAGGLWGTQILCDLAGNDTYHAARVDLGAGLFGWGILIDAGGDDVYTGDTIVEGAGAFGLGLLVDSAGNDAYHGALYAQGFGFTGGAGALVDRRGNDRYSAGGVYKDVLRYVDRYLSLSQGFAYGVRPFLSGGIGLLYDFEGNDDYAADIFAQGASYWWGLGGLWDGGGNDRYLAFQYAQGSATHMTAGVLVDEGGDDLYFGKGVSQGCGHDLAAGLLWDLGGGDVYTAYDLSQGAGSANGTGVLFDAAGDDRYYVHSRLNTQGYGNPRRDYGSIGLFLDGGGRDRYDGPGSDSTWWRVESQWGAGIDYSPAAQDTVP
jgi:hypothetical protein